MSDLDFDLSNLEIPESLHRNGSGAPVHKGRKPIPRFHWKSVISSYHTEREGRPVPVRKLMCTQVCVGSKDQPGDVEVKFITSPMGKVTPDPTNIIVKRYPLELKKFLELGEVPDEGIPLEQWPRMTSDLIAVCAYLQIRTVEQLAGCKDNEEAIGKLGRGGRALVEQAYAFINQKSDESFAQRLAAEKEEMRAEKEQMRLELDRSKAQHAELMRQNAEILEQLKELSGAKGKKNG